MTKHYHTISHDAARELIYSQRINGQGRIFGVAFRRRTNSRDNRRKEGDMEVVYCRFGVRRHLKGGYKVKKTTGNVPVVRVAAYDRCSKNVFCAYVFNRKHARGGQRGYRSIPFEGIKWLKLDGVVYKVGQPAPVQH